MDWIADLWNWATDDGSVGALAVAALVTVLLVMLAGTAFIWTLAGLKWVGQRFMDGHRRST